MLGERMILHTKQIICAAVVLLPSTLIASNSNCADWTPDRVASLKVLASQGHPGAQSTLGLLYMKGKGVEQDYHKAKEWLEKSVAQDEGSAQIFLGCLYYNGQGVRQNYHKARELFEKAAAHQGDIKTQAEAQFLLGALYEEGAGVPRNLTTARTLYEKSALQGNVRAQATLGAYYEHGYGGVKRNLAIAKEWYGKACDNGFQTACDEYRRLNTGEK